MVTNTSVGLCLCVHVDVSGEPLLHPVLVIVGVHPRGPRSFRVPRGWKHDLSRVCEHGTALSHTPPPPSPRLSRTPDFVQSVWLLPFPARNTVCLLGTVSMVCVSDCHLLNASPQMCHPG